MTFDINALLASYVLAKPAKPAGSAPTPRLDSVEGFADAAAHEASHAVIGALLGLKFIVATVETNGEGSCHYGIGRRRKRLEQLDALRDAAFTVAGDLGVRIYRGRSDETALEGQFGDDDFALGAAARFLGTDDEDACELVLERVEAIVGRVLHDPSVVRAVNAVSKRLNDHGIAPNQLIQGAVDQAGARAARRELLAGLEKLRIDRARGRRG